MKYQDKKDQEVHNQLNYNQIEN